MDLLVFGINHKTAPVAVREHWACSSAASEHALRRCQDRVADSEHLILSTCNRTEFYSYLPKSASPIGTVEDFEAQCLELSRFYSGCLPTDADGDLAQRSAQHMPGHFYVHRMHDAVGHLFRVAGGLDSLIVGETEILGQLKSAFALAQSAGSTGPLFNRLFPQALKVGKRVRSVTGISRGCITPGQAALKLAESVVPDLSQADALLIGGGEIAQIVARSCVERGVRRFTVVNRTRERADALLSALADATSPDEQTVDEKETVDENPQRARRAIRGTARDWFDLDQILAEADVVISSTGSEYPLIESARLEAVQARRGGRPLVIVDLAIPRDFHPDVGDIEGVQLFNIDDLNDVVNTNIASRLDHVQKAEEIIEEQILNFFGRMSFVQIDPVIRRLVERFEGIRLGELQASLDRFPTEYHSVVDEVTRRLVRKLINFPIERIKAIRDMRGLGPDHIRVLKQLFLHDSPNSAGTNEESEWDGEERRAGDVTERGEAEREVEGPPDASR